jgi:hypothetical protein
VESELSPGGGFRIPHWHEDLYEVFYVLKGEIDYLLGGDWRVAPVGATVFIPTGAVHAFRNASGRPARHLVAGPPRAVEMLTELSRHPRCPGPAQWGAVGAFALAEQQVIRFTFDRLAGLEAERFGAGAPPAAVLCHRS